MRVGAVVMHTETRDFPLTFPPSSARDGDLDLDTGLEIERAAFAGVFATEDSTAGMRSFVESGPWKATFTGR